MEALQGILGTRKGPSKWFTSLQQAARKGRKLYSGSKSRWLCLFIFKIVHVKCEAMVINSIFKIEFNVKILSSGMTIVN
jgi:hypothetical protein